MTAVGCDKDPSDGNGDGDGDGLSYLGKTPTLSGQVYVGEKGNNKDELGSIGPAYTGEDLTVFAVEQQYGPDGSPGEIPAKPPIDPSDPAPAPAPAPAPDPIKVGEGTIKGGQLSITLGTPTELGNWNDVFGYPDDSVNPNTAKFYVQSSFSVSDNTSNYSDLYRENITSSTWEGVDYLYADKDVTISSQGGTSSWEYRTEITRPFSLTLKAGWNTLYCKKQESGNTTTYTYSLSNPSNLKWVLWNHERISADEAARARLVPDTQIR